jgi:glycolate oxidase FAD binding subunit
VTASIEAIQEAFRGNGRVLPVGGGSKPALSTPPAPDVTALDMSALSGIVEYDPAELTITVRAGTPVAQVSAVLAEHGQHLPFDPLLPSRATMGGVVASGTTGPSAYGRGCVRDFIIGVRFVDGTGLLVSGGGRVVKNAAGFDLPKLMVGSMGRLGVLVELCFKVFPVPHTTTTAILDFDAAADAVAALSSLGRSPLSLEALDFDPPARLLVRLGGAAETAPARIAAVTGRAPSVLIVGEHDAAVWHDAAEMAWADPQRRLVRATIRPRVMRRLVASVAAAGGRMRCSLGASVAWIEWPSSKPLAQLDQILCSLESAGMVLTGPPERLLVGRRMGGAFAERIRQALDPNDRFARA